MPSAAIWMQLEIIILSKSERERQIPYDITYMQNLKYDTNELISETYADSDLENRLVAAQEKEFRGRMEWETGVSSYRLLYTEWMNKKIILYSTENNIHYPVINHNRKEY